MLESAWEARGAELGERYGARLPLRFTEDRSEWQAFAEQCAVVPLSHRALLEARGGDRMDFLQGMLSNDVRALASGEGCAAFMLQQNGKVISDLRVLVAEDRVLLDVLVWRWTALREALDRFLVADDVELDEPADGLCPLVAVAGPAARQIAGEVLGEEALPARPYHGRASKVDGIDVRIAMVSESGDPGVVIHGPAAHAGAIFDALRAAGAVPAGMNALDVRRVERGVPWAGIDMGEEDLAMEVGLDEALSFRKGCYVGQEVVERVASRGHVNRRLRGLRVAGDRLVPAGARLFAGDRDVGVVRSAVRSFACEQVIGLAYVHRRCWDEGTELIVRGEETEATARVCDLPFVAA